MVSVANGVINALSEGSSIITVKTEDGGKTAACEVTVFKKEEEPNPPAPSSGNDFTGRVAAGYYGSGIIRNNGDVYTWGNNDSGQLGDGTNTEKLKPTKIESGLVAFD